MSEVAAVERLEVDRVVCGDCAEVLRTLPADSVDACVTDPPYGLGVREPEPREIVAYLNGAALLVGGDFMGAEWRIPSVRAWRRVWRVLKPGGHVLAFGGTRTWDLISLGLRAAGFELRDTIAANAPGLEWIQGQGFPKSANVGKALEGTRAGGRWAGWGSALKPSWEPILVFRKPLGGKLAANLLTHGAGALNVDGCRVKHASPADFDKHKAMVDRLKSKGGTLADSWANHSDLAGASEVKSAGRWPPNLTLVHAPGCVRVGTKRIKGSGSGIPVHTGAGQGYNQGWQAGVSTSNYVGSDGLEPMENWQCAPGCPVAALDEQSGERRAALFGRADPEISHENPGDNAGASWFGGGNSRVYADKGGASRYFPSFEPADPPFLYCPKARKRDQGIANNHPTRKPVALMRWLVRLVTPAGGLVLDPFCGSGSTLHAAILEGVHFLGIEQDPAHAELARGRVAAVLEGAKPQPKVRRKRAAKAQGTVGS